MDNRKTQANDAETKFFCPYLKRNISEGLCYDMQMIAYAYIKPDALPDMEIDRQSLKDCCEWCEHRLQAKIK